MMPQLWMVEFWSCGEQSHSAVVRCDRHPTDAEALAALGYEEEHQFIIVYAVDEPPVIN